MHYKRNAMYDSLFNRIILFLTELIFSKKPCFKIQYILHDNVMQCITNVVQASHLMNSEKIKNAEIIRKNNNFALVR